MSWEAYDYIIVCHDIIITCKMSKSLIEKSKTLILRNRLFYFICNVRSIGVFEY